MRLAVVLLLAVFAGSPAAAFLAQNGLLVRADGPDEFNVPYRGLAGPTDFWCAAGDYARNELGLPTAQRIYRVSEPPRGSGEGVRFSVRPEASARSTGLAVLGAKAGGLTVGMARSFCENRREWRR